MIEHKRDVLPEIGPQLDRAESRHAARLRFHQSWYRARRLGITEWGYTGRGRELGSILPAKAAKEGRNFVSADAMSVYLRRRAQGWGVDPTRTTAYMTSSQALLINLVGVISRRQGWLLQVLSGALGRSDIHQIRSLQLEYAPTRRNHYLADMTRVDLFVVLESRRGLETVVMELKYADRFSA